MRSATTGTPARSATLAADNQDVRREIAEHRELAVENRRRADREPALVDTAHPPRLTAGENGAAHQVRVDSSSGSDPVETNGGQTPNPR